MAQTVFKRYEIKYLLTRAQKEALVAAMSPQMQLDCYGHSTVRSLYYDTDTYRLARRSAEKPVYKEKLRLRCYGKAASAESEIFAELKKKYASVVYKRRMALPEKEADAWLRGCASPRDTQIAEEIEYFRRYYETLAPRVFLSYEREAYFDTAGSDFRVTFDEAILARTEDLSLCCELGGTPLLAPDRVLMEVKTAGGMPLWFAALLTENRIFHTSFSKYGTAYERLILPKMKNRLSAAVCSAQTNIPVPARTREPRLA